MLRASPLNKALVANEEKRSQSGIFWANGLCCFHLILCLGVSFLKLRSMFMSVVVVCRFRSRFTC